MHNVPSTNDPVPHPAIPIAIGQTPSDDLHVEADFRDVEEMFDAYDEAQAGIESDHEDEEQKTAMAKAEADASMDSLDPDSLLKDYLDAGSDPLLDSGCD